MGRLVIIALGLALAVAAACSGHTPSGGPPDSKVFMDSGGGNVCAGSAYDPCTPGSTTTCESGLQCHTFTGNGFSTCSPVCSGTSPCPNQGSTTITCNMMGTCKPPAPNTCTAAP